MMFVPRALAARAVSGSPSPPASFWYALGAMAMGMSYRLPRIVVLVSMDVTSRRTCGRNRSLVADFSVGIRVCRVFRMKTHFLKIVSLRRTDNSPSAPVM